MEYAHVAPIIKDILGPLMKVHAKAQADKALPSLEGIGEAQTFFALSELFHGLATQGPTVLFLDDLHWMDATSVSFIDFLFRGSFNVPIFLLLSSREADSSQVQALDQALSRSSAHSVERRQLGALSPADTLQVLRDLLSDPVSCSDGAAQWLTESCAGNPRYLKEILTVLRDKGVLRRENKTWVVDNIPTTLILPPSYSALINSRITRLLRDRPEQAELLRVASVVGPRFDAETLSGVLQRSRRNVLSDLSVLASDTGYIHRIGKSSEYAFEHELTRESIVCDLGNAAVEYHADVARWLDTHGAHRIVVATHFSCAECWAEAAKQYRLAAEHSVGDYAFETAAAARRRQAEMLDRLGVERRTPEHIMIRVDEADALARAGQYQRADDTLRDAIGLDWRGGTAILSPEDVARSALIWARALLNLSSITKRHQAIDLLRHALDRLGVEDAFRGVLLEALVHAFDGVGDRPHAQGAFQSAVAAAKAHRDHHLEIRLLRLACLFFQPERAATACRSGLRLARRHNDRIEQAFCENNLGSQMFYLQELNEARAHWEHSLDILRTHGGVHRDVPQNNLSLLDLLDGNIHRAREHFETALHWCTAPLNRILIQANIAIADALLASNVSAEERLRAMVREADRCGDVFYMDVVRHNLARILAIRGAHENALSVLVQVPPRTWLTDDALIRGKRAQFILDLYRLMGMRTPQNHEREASVLKQTTKPQAWLYRQEWEFCDIQFLSE